MRQIRNVAGGSGRLYHGHRDRGVISGYVSTTSRGLEKTRRRGDDPHTTEFILPPRRTADYLLSIYWESSYAIFSFVNKLDFENSYSLLWTGFEDVSADEQAFHCNLNLMFAIACKLDQSGPPSDQAKSSDVYFERAKTLLKFDPLEVSRFALIQAFLLMAQYLQSTNMPRQCFQSIGMAIWIAQDMGLHMPQTTSTITNIRERELARRANPSIIAAMAFGRPSRISQEVAPEAPPLLPVDDGDFDYSDVGSRRSSQPAKMELYIEYCKLHFILGDILLALYVVPNQELTADEQKPKARSLTQDLDLLLDIDKRLIKWRSELGAHLQVSTHLADTTTLPLFHRQANILHARYVFALVV
ncbi:hypothetical protein B0A49_11532 [Cryomyces minteri]|uniref:Xylanolytic transcriptional activator regulatory domain-containing protein n=1 Tax=Cryomyces minteri TaxID=331657 RepID=A0A4U0W9F1_9PEZI|nr:hypothetical protein B0A49_11532 [Cryomyces minteri]